VLFGLLSALIGSHSEKNKGKKNFFSPQKNVRATERTFFCVVKNVLLVKAKRTFQKSQEEVLPIQKFLKRSIRRFFFFARVKYLHAFHVHIHTPMFIQCFSVAPPRRRRRHPRARH
jgi:hypothetical protein